MRIFCFPGKCKSQNLWSSDFEIILLISSISTIVFRFVKKSFDLDNFSYLSFEAVQNPHLKDKHQEKVVGKEDPIYHCVLPRWKFLLIFNFWHFIPLSIFAIHQLFTKVSMIPCPITTNLKQTSTSITWKTESSTKQTFTYQGV